jgi:hypothetical protein
MKEDLQKCTHVVSEAQYEAKQYPCSRQFVILFLATLNLEHPQLEYPLVIWFFSVNGLCRGLHTQHNLF